MNQPFAPLVGYGGAHQRAVSGLARYALRRDGDAANFLLIFWKKVVFCGSVNVFEARSRFTFCAEILLPLSPSRPVRWLTAPRSRLVLWERKKRIRRTKPGITEGQLRQH